MVSRFESKALPVVDKPMKLRIAQLVLIGMDKRLKSPSLSDDCTRLMGPS
jgi:hypothetical protein